MLATLVMGHVAVSVSAFVTFRDVPSIKGPCRSRYYASLLNNNDGDPAEAMTSYDNPVTAFLGSFLPQPPRGRTNSSSVRISTQGADERGVSSGEGTDSTDSGFAGIDWSAQKRSGLGLHDLAREVCVGIARREWFVTGMVRPEYFDDAFVFKVSPSIQHILSTT
jgi:hypothetical protein